MTNFKKNIQILTSNHDQVSKPLYLHCIYCSNCPTTDLQIWQYRQCL